MKILSTGNSTLPSQHKPLKLTNILHVPAITKNLLIVHQFALNNNVFIEFHAFFCLVKDNKTEQVLLKGTYKDCLYVLDNIHKCHAYLGEKALTEIWHNRLGHPHFRILQNILKIFELPLTHKLSHYVCDACCSSKSHKQPFKFPYAKALDLLNLFIQMYGGQLPLHLILAHYYVLF